MMMLLLGLLSFISVVNADPVYDAANEKNTQNLKEVLSQPGVDVNINDGIQ